jgi:hypothetical protein
MRKENTSSKIAVQIFLHGEANIGFILVSCYPLRSAMVLTRQHSITSSALREWSVMFESVLGCLETENVLLDCKVWSGLIWLRIGTSGGLL